ncbi:MAG TPA: hypothetical protein VGO11_21765 [Chthoniobacteraceae bacterium]|jgi:hypothetical protein|nr:hypothetical protein [Chthoniobacteraceae bacterium]
MEPITLARKLGTTPHISPLLVKARRLGLPTGEHREALAVARGLRYYGGESLPAVPPLSREQLSDEELAMALLSIAAPYSPQGLRVGAAMSSGVQNDAWRLVWLARLERSEIVLRYVAECGVRFEPGNDFWEKILAALPPTGVVPSGVLPHPTRFVAMTGFTRRGVETVIEWIRPEPALAHG